MTTYLDMVEQQLTSETRAVFTEFSEYSGLSLYLELERDQQICSRQRKFEIEKITVRIKIFTNKAREVDKGLLGMY